MRGVPSPEKQHHPPIKHFGVNHSLTGTEYSNHPSLHLRKEVVSSPHKCFYDSSTVYERIPGTSFYLLKVIYLFRGPMRHFVIRES